MNENITHRAWFGDGEHAFCLTDEMVAELEATTGKGVGELYFGMLALAYPAGHLQAVIRLGLIGGGMNPAKAARLVETYATNRPLAETLGLAFEIMSSRWTGNAEKDRLADDAPEAGKEAA